MLDSKTLKVIDEALDMALDTLIEENALKKDSPYAQRFLNAQKKVRFEIDKCGKNRKGLVAQKRGRVRD